MSFFFPVPSQPGREFQGCPKSGTTFFYYWTKCTLCRYPQHWCADGGVPQPLRPSHPWRPKPPQLKTEAPNIMQHPTCPISGKNNAVGWVCGHPHPTCPISGKNKGVGWGCGPPLYPPPCFPPQGRQPRTDRGTAEYIPPIIPNGRDWY